MKDYPLYLLTRYENVSYMNIHDKSFVIPQLINIKQKKDPHRSSVNLFKNSNGAFQVVQEGYFSPTLLTTRNEILVERILLDEIEKNINQPLLRNPTRIFRKNTMEEWGNYDELQGVKEIQLEECRHIQINSKEFFVVFNVGLYFTTHLATILQSFVTKAYPDCLFVPGTPIELC